MKVDGYPNPQKICDDCFKDEQQLPPGWVYNEEEKFYFNEITEESSWERPKHKESRISIISRSQVLENPDLDRSGESVTSVGVLGSLGVAKFARPAGSSVADFAPQPEEN
eukprot:CAMPEP_0175166422 /NCGR_PEP_ID=MMETSP0087-20121206/27702_1 /TAXON_ID=136419 /ORGANISM="Unknown Unknown, Strain D1" /LENGTH=109 /DNA_ID=CAMNT_0016456047 /DNA_START=377 /DNA_END=706 /DNA_ORIENTATION=+